MKKPIIGISASMIYEEKDELFLGNKYSCVAYSYVDAVYKSGGIPITLPILKDVFAIREQVKLLDGLILSVAWHAKPGSSFEGILARRCRREDVVYLRQLTKG